jgi:hypothetical protein
MLHPTHIFLRRRTIDCGVAKRSQGQFGPARYVQLTKDVIEVFLYGAFTEAEIVGDLLIRFRFGNEAYNLLFPERKDLTLFAKGPVLGCPACGTCVLFSEGVKAVPAASTAPRHG